MTNKEIVEALMAEEENRKRTEDDSPPEKEFRRGKDRMVRRPATPYQGRHRTK